MIWREKKAWFIGLGLLLLVNVFVFFTYRVRQQERIEELNAKQASLEQRLAEVKRGREAKERQLKGYRKVVSDVDHIYSDLWATSDSRLTALLGELYRLASKSGLRPTGYSYSFSSDDKAERTTTMEISFSVKGRYEQVRQMVRLLELSEQFVFIDSITLSGNEAEPGSIQLNLRLKTIFGEPLLEGGKKS